MDIPADTDAISKTVSDFINAAGLLLTTGKAAPAMWRDKGAPIDVRLAAYVSFTDAAIRAYTLAQYLPEFAKVNQKPIIMGGPWNATSKALDVLADSSRALADLLAATARVRLVGGLGPVEALRPVLRGLIDMYGSLPVGLRKGTREAKVPDFENGQAAFTDALPVFTDACRLDLAYKRPLRQHRWQLTRPKPPKKP